MSAKACPLCDGTSGFTSTLTEQHTVNGPWGGEAEAADHNWARYGLFQCLDCGSKFGKGRLTRAGLLKLPGDVPSEVR